MEGFWRQLYIPKQELLLLLVEEIEENPDSKLKLKGKEILATYLDPETPKAELLNLKENLLEALEEDANAIREKLKEKNLDQKFKEKSQKVLNDLLEVKKIIPD